MLDIRNTTIASYNQHVDEYIRKKDGLHTQRTAKYWPGVSFFLSKLEPGDVIYEVGSGSGYDANQIEALGFKVTRSDAAKIFVQRLRQRGFEASDYDVLNGPIEPKVAAIYANAVLLHFNQELFRRALTNLTKSLISGGLLCIGMKLGDFEGWSDAGLGGPRYFKLWDQAELKQELTTHGLGVLNEKLTPDSAFIVITAVFS